MTVFRINAANYQSRNPLADTFFAGSKLVRRSCGLAIGARSRTDSHPYDAHDATRRHLIREKEIGVVTILMRRPAPLLVRSGAPWTHLHADVMSSTDGWRDVVGYQREKMLNDLNIFRCTMHYHMPYGYEFVFCSSMSLFYSIHCTEFWPIGDIQILACSQVRWCLFGLRLDFAWTCDEGRRSVLSNE